MLSIASRGKKTNMFDCRYFQNILINLPDLWYTFSPLGKLADRAIYFTFRNILSFLTVAQLSQDLMDRFSRFFIKWKVFAWTLSIETSFSCQPIFGKIGEITFIQHAGVSNGFEYRNFDLRMIKGNIIATFLQFWWKSIQ